MNKTSGIFLAGHKGLVGSAILRHLRDKAYTNIILRTSSELDLRRQVDTERFFEAERPEYVFLAAAKVGGIIANSTYKADFIYDNLMIAANIVNCAWKYGVRKLINLGSSCIYPRHAPQPMKEEHLLTGPLEPTNEPYAIAKIAAIKLCRYYNEQYGTDFLTVMPTNLYGPFDNYNLETAHVLPALIRKFHLARIMEKGGNDCQGAIRRDLAASPVGFGIDALHDSDPIAVLESLGVTASAVTLWGSGEPYREFLYSDELAGACVYLMERYGHEAIGELLNIGTGEDMQIKDIAAMVKDIVGFKGEVRYDSTKPDGTPRKLLDVSNIKALGWHPTIALEEGIRRAYESYLHQVSDK
ncbi:GDP-L-fucose synthase family protein [Candidatus Magnetominusculus dajiuhuensis]|uniref:GDP-L-fucose synthase family protein n=1 Tax=Candidatus Magnetominusculus dajiuhuensis TaxID=3137712 RepID=UPI003B43CF7A